jgi:hypothetical protein
MTLGPRLLVRDICYEAVHDYPATATATATAIAKQQDRILVN